MNLSRLAPLLLTLAACDAQVDGDHQGTALATLEGTVSSTRRAPVASADVMIVWVTDGDGDFITGQRVGVEGSFPANFSLAMYEPPDPVVLVGEPGQQLGIAYIAAVEEGQTSVEDEPLGLDPEHVLVYVPEAITEGSLASYFLHSTPAAGFHIYGFRRLSEAEYMERETCKLALPADASMQELYEQCGGDTFDEVVPTVDDLETALSVQLVDDFASLNLANWM